MTGVQTCALPIYTAFLRDNISSAAYHDPPDSEFVELYFEKNPLIMESIDTKVKLIEATAISK